MEAYKGRALDVGKSVRVYRNLHRGGYSVVQGGLVVAHAQDITLSDCTMHVCEGARQRVISTRRKVVHAWVCGRVAERVEANQPLRYNPYEAGYFRNTAGEPVWRADCVSLSSSVHYLPYIERRL